MHSQSHSVWCKCQRKEGGSQHHYPEKDVESYEEMLRFCDEEVGCEIKTHEEMCGWAHYSPGVAKGGKFTPFRCSCCGYAPTEVQWRADLAAWHTMSDEDQAAALRKHLDQDDELNTNFQHYHQLLFTPPLSHHGMDRCGVDNLHLVYLNISKHLFRYTIHECIPSPAKKAIVRDYCQAAGFYSCAASDY